MDDWEVFKDILERKRLGYCIFFDCSYLIIVRNFPLFHWKQKKDKDQS